MNPQQLAARRAIESLRSGVPGRSAVEELGTTQATIREAFEERLAGVEAGEGVAPLFITAEFGQGKSHLLSCLRAISMGDGFVTSSSVVSPEMPLGNAHVVLRKLAEAAEVQGHVGRALRSLASDLRINDTPYASLRLWARDSGIDERFPALLQIYEESRGDEELRTLVLGDLEGSALPLTRIREEVRRQAAGYQLKAKRAALLAHDRIRLLARFYRACGAKGWVVFFDELERFTVFPPKQRLLVWDELEWWAAIARQHGAAILPVFAGVHPAIQKSREDDSERLGSGLPGLGIGDSARDLARALQMVNNPMPLEPPTPEQEEEIKYRVAGIYERAYGVKTRSLPPERFSAASTVRSRIRKWITLWDLERCYPDYSPDVATDEVVHDDREASDEVLAGDESEGGA